MEDAVTFKLLIEGEHSTLGLRLDIASSTTTTEEDLRGRRGNACCWGGGAKEARAQAAIIACTTAASMVKGTSVMDGRTLGDLDGHCDGFFYRDVRMGLMDDSW